ncbi:MAG TPA: glycoside hydrolase family 27 protein [Prolixibacteraceae bacterium]|nr:glycoside hydrolase family 27 protein [Prolixibacteraceae bacterium]
MKNTAFILILAICSLMVTAQGQMNLPKPPLGWNSWTNYGWKITEKQILETADAMVARLKQFGYEYIVLDAGWHEGVKKPQDTVDQYGQLCSKTKFPHGIPWLAGQVHARGLKFGIHLMRGVSRDGYKNNIPVFGTPFLVRDVADTTSLCGWSNDNYGINMSKPGAQEYYDSYIGQIVSWGVDFIKIDDITEHPEEVLAVKKAIIKTGKRVVLSLSPGDNSMTDLAGAYNEADMVRVTPDIWDNQKGIDQCFTSWRRWSEVTGRKFWADMDMIPFGHLGLSDPNPNYLEPVKGEGFETGRERMSAFSKDQKYTFISLRALSASPLMMGGTLNSSDDFSFELITNKDMLACDQNGVIGKLVYEKDSVEIWKTPKSDNPNEGWLGVFNRGKKARQLKLSLADFREQSPISLFNVWENKDLGKLTGTSGMDMLINPNGVAFCRYKND